MLNRLIIKELNKWSQQSDRKPLILRGARQVGKTTIVNEFSKQFDQFISLNLDKDTDRNLFETGNSFETILESIFYFAGKLRFKGKTLIFIDEIQSSSEAIKLLRYFFEDASDLFVIAAGSLLETLMNSGATFPVGRVEYLALRPCSFLEYLDATGEERSLNLIQALEFPLYAHSKMIDLFQEYTIIGGMPEIVKKFVANKDLVSLKRTYNGLITSYKDDVEKYASNKNMQVHIRHIIESGFPFAATRIKFERFANSDYKSREMGEAFRVLEKTMLLELVYPTTSNTPPIYSNVKKSPKLFWLDTGLLNYAAGIQKEVFLDKELNSAFKGKVAEHIVGQELIAYNFDVLCKRNFWTREEKNSNSEIDFVIPYKHLLIPIEVKAGSSGRLKSLQWYMKEVKHGIAIRVCSNPFSIEEIKINSLHYQLFNIPFYALSQIDNILDRHFGT